MNYPKDGPHVQLSTHFNSSEFRCHCTNASCTQTEIDPDLVTKLEALREAVGAPLEITSGFRCAAYQDELRARGFETALGVSQHQLGRAADVRRADQGSTGDELEALARKAGFMAVGVGKHWIHADLRSDRERRWEYSY